MNGCLFFVHIETSAVSHRTVPLASCETESDVAALGAEWQQRIGEAWTVCDSRVHTNFTIPEPHPAWESGGGLFDFLKSFWTVCVRHLPPLDEERQADPIAPNQAINDSAGSGSAFAWGNADESDAKESCKKLSQTDTGR